MLIISLAFVLSILVDKVGNDYFAWSKDSYSSDEMSDYILPKRPKKKRFTIKHA